MNGNGSNKSLEAHLIVGNPTEIIVICRARFSLLGFLQVSLECVQTTESIEATPNSHDTLVLHSDPALPISGPGHRLSRHSGMLEPNSPANVG